MIAKLLLILILNTLISCNRNDLLISDTGINLKSIKSKDDIYNIYKNRFLFDWTSNIPTLITDEIELIASETNNLNLRDVSFYFWNDNFIIQNENFDDWNYLYNKILTANGIIEFYENKSLDSLDKYYLSIAFYIRSKSYFELVLLHNDADFNSIEKFGIPIRKTSHIDEKINQLNLKATFEFIEKDIYQSMTNLDLNFNPNKKDILLNPKWIYAFAAQFYLYIGEYLKSLNFSNILLSHNNHDLIDFNNYTNQTTRIFLEEDIIGPMTYFNNDSRLLNIISNNNIYINLSLIEKYNSHDTRLKLFFNFRNNRYYYKNAYLNNAFSLFSGYTYSEIYLIKMETEWRLGLYDEYILSTQKWIHSRYTSNPFNDEYIQSMQFIIDEREKELVMRGTKLFDVKRFYRENIIIPIKKFSQSTTITLTAADARINIIYPPLVVNEYKLIQVPR